MDRPNILFAFADDWGRYASCYASHERPNSLNALVRTPNIDRVADEGVLFTNAVVPAPSCTPCRSSVLSGRYFWQTGLGAILHGAVWDETIPSFPLLLEGAGYHIGFTYKVWSPGTPKDQPFGGASRCYEPGGRDFGRYSFVATERAGGPHVVDPDRVEAAKRTLDEETRANFAAFLDAGDQASPFCYWWGPTNTHREWQRGSGRTLWGIDPSELTGRLPGFLPDVHEVREDVADYLGECMAFDRGLGVLLDVLAERGRLDDTLVVVSGDHGIPGFPRGKCNLYDIGTEVALVARLPRLIRAGRVVDDMVNLMDLAPTFLEAGRVAPPPDLPARSLMPLLTAEGSGQIDPTRTFAVTGRERHVGFAREWNLPYPHRAIRTSTHLYIRNYAPDRWPMGDPRGLDDPDVTPPDFHVLEHETYAAYADMDAGPTKAWMIHHRGDPRRRAAFELGFGKRPAEELYDVVADPDTTRNLAGDPAHEAERSRLARALEEELTRQRDPRVVETDCRYDLPPFTDATGPHGDAEDAPEVRLARVRRLPEP